MPQEPAISPYPERNQCSPRLASSFWKISFNNTFPNIRVGFKWPLSFRCPDQDPVCISPPCLIRATSSAPPNLLFLPLAWYLLRVTKYERPYDTDYPVSSRFLPLKLKHTPQRHILRRFFFVYVFSLVWQTKCTWAKSKRQNCCIYHPRKKTDWNKSSIKYDVT